MMLPGYGGLSYRALNGMNNAVGLDKDPAETARRLRCIGNREFLRQPNVGRVTCREVFVWAWAQFYNTRRGNRLIYEIGETCLQPYTGV